MNNNDIAKKILSLQQQSYKIEAEIIGFDEIPPLKEDIVSLQTSHEFFWGYFIEDELVGAISYKTIGLLLDIHRLMVHPLHFKKGIASLLLEFIMNKNEEITTFIVSTGTKNFPAIRLYEKFGFREVDVVRITKELSLTKFKLERSYFAE